jgi:DNA-binding Xre family transcriptional regulator
MDSRQHAYSEGELSAAKELLLSAAAVAPAAEVLGDRIRRLRRERVGSLDQLARETKISRGQLWKLETHRATNPGLRQLRTLAEALGCSPGYLADSKPERSGQ